MRASLGAVVVVAAVCAIGALYQSRPSAPRAAADGMSPAPATASAKPTATATTQSAHLPSAAGPWLVLRDGSAVMHAAYPDDRLLRFDPARQQESSYVITHGAGEAGLVETQAGLLLAGGSASHGISDRLTWLEWHGATGIDVFAHRLHQAREAPAMIALPDHSVWVVGGTIGYTSSSGGSQVRIRSNAVDRVWRENGVLRVEALPDVPGPPRWGMRVVALADGRVLALGGTSSEFIGCNQCLAESYLFDPSTRVWQRGPDLLSARADASATLLPDGRVLVAGGWTEASG